jgi:hypothetical protein
MQSNFLHVPEAIAFIFTSDEGAVNFRNTHIPCLGVFYFTLLLVHCLLNNTRVVTDSKE